MSKATIGYKYFMSMHMGLCRGPIDELSHIRIGDRDAWMNYGASRPPTLQAMALPSGSDPGSATNNGGFPTGGGYGPGSYLTNGRFAINAPNLFGGEDGQGGVQGSCWFMDGNDAQVSPTPLLDQLTKVPGIGYRGMASIFFDGMICAMSANPQPWKMRLRRVIGGWDGSCWYPENAVIWLRNDNAPVSLDNLKNIRAMNPAHILYQCATDRVWGRGLPRSRLDEAAYRKVADQLYDEGFGLCMPWSRSDSMSSFIQSLLDHIAGVQYLDRETGLLTIGLLRDDYDPNSLPLFTPDSGLLAIDEDSAATNDVMANEQIVTYVDPCTGSQGSTRAHNPGAFQAQGAVNSRTTDYPGIPTNALARRAAARDLRAWAPGLRRFKVQLDRSGRQVKPGGCFRVTDPKNGLGILILRAGDFQDGTLMQGAITITGVQDVFGLPSTTYLDEQPGGWEPPVIGAAPVTVEKAQELSYRDLILAIGAPAVAAMDPLDGYVGVLARKPTNTSLGYDMYEKIDAATSYTLARPTGHYSPVGKLAAPLIPGHGSIVLVMGDNLDEVTLGSAVYIDDEILRLDSFNAEVSTATLAGGCADTVPATHATGSVVWISDDDLIPSPTKYQDGEVVDLALLTKSSTGILDLADATQMTVTLDQRAARPYPPAGDTIDGSPWYEATQAQGVFSLTWKERNRITAADQLVDAGMPTMQPEPGTSYIVRLFDAQTNALLATREGVVGTAISLNTGFEGSLRIEVRAVRDGLESWQALTGTINHTNMASGHRVTSDGSVRTTTGGGDRLVE